MPRKKVLSEEDKKNIALLKAQNEMYERTKEEIRLRGTKEAMKRTEEAQSDVIKKAESIMGKEADKYIAPSTEDNSPISNNDSNDEDEDIFTILQENAEKEKENEIVDIKDMGTKTANEEEILDFSNSEVGQGEIADNNSNTVDAYDVIPLPSNGECYKSKIGRIPVAYLTAYDENLITSPNLYRDGLVIDLLLKNKILDKTINPDDLVNGDVDAIVLFLRATSYGTDFPISVSDPKTGKNIETVVDLSTIKLKEFKLKADEDGHFDFTLPKTQKLVKFKYLTRKEEKNLRTLNELENKALVASNLRAAKKTIEDSLKADDTLDGKEKTVIFDEAKKLETWAKRIESKRRIQFNKAITNRMEMQIVSIDGITDRKKIKQMVDSMPAYDSLKLRKYILDNEPGVNFEIEVKRPESLGGGSFKTFLSWDDTVFLNIA
jgi:hypothetical protein